MTSDSNRGAGSKSSISGCFQLEYGKSRACAEQDLADAQFIDWLGFGRCLGLCQLPMSVRSFLPIKHSIVPINPYSMKIVAGNAAD